MSFKFNGKALIWTVIIYLFVFQRSLINSYKIVGYLDEVFTLIAVGALALKAITRRVVFEKKEKQILSLFLLLCLLGCACNISSKLLDNNLYIMVDMLSTIKVWIAFFAVIITNYSLKTYDKIILYSARIARVLIVLMLLFWLVSLFVNVGMMGTKRMGFSAYQFVFGNPGNYSKLFYFLIPLLTAELYYKLSIYKIVMICLSLFLWITTFRSRSFAFVTIYLILAYFFFYANGNQLGERVKHRVKLVYLIPVILVGVAITWNQIVFYFTSATQARAVLLRYGLKTLIDYFPLGSGFGTFGSDVAMISYSPLYTQYGFNYFYGMRQGEELYLNDNYWPMIMGQFGVIGVGLVIIILYKYIKLTLKDTKNNKYFYFSVLCTVIFLLLSSVASKSYSEFSSICIYLLVGFLVKRSRIVERVDKS